MSLPYYGIICLTAKRGGFGGGGYAEVGVEVLIEARGAFITRLAEIEHPQAGGNPDATPYRKLLAKRHLQTLPRPVVWRARQPRRFWKKKARPRHPSASFSNYKRLAEAPSAQHAAPPVCALERNDIPLERASLGELEAIWREH